MKILYSLATRSRPTKAFSCIENILSLAKHDNFKIRLSCDVDDETMANREVQNRIDSYGDKVSILYGISHSKVSAINRDVLLGLPFSVLCNHSDDFVFTKEGFDLDILEAFEGYSGLVHFPDQVAGDKLITYAMMSMDYYELDNFIYHNDFESVYCDNLQMYMAQKRGKYKFVDKQILRHEHFSWGFGEKDALLEKTENPVTYAKDRETFKRLKKEFDENL